MHKTWNVGQTGFYWLGFKDHLTKPLLKKKKTIVPLHGLICCHRAGSTGTVSSFWLSNRSLKNILMWDLILAAAAAAHNSTLFFFFFFLIKHKSVFDLISKPMVYIIDTVWWQRYLMILMWALILGVRRAPVMVALALIECGMKYEDAVQFIRQ